MFRESIIKHKKILISGAGIAGLALARQLKKLNIPFVIIEKRSHMTTDGAGIALPANAVQALRYIGLSSDIDLHGYQVQRIIYTDTTGMVLSDASLSESPLNRDRFVALHRNQFHKILCQDIEDKICFGTTIDLMTPTKSGILVKFNNPEMKPEEFSAVIGADGINSRVRQLIFKDTSLTDLGVTIWRWTCKFPTHDLQPTYMLGARDVFMVYPISENEVYCYSHIFDPQDLSSKFSDNKMLLKKHFGEYGGIAKIMLSILPDNRYIIPGRLRSISQPVFSSGRVALIGDAGHACSPILQQGAASALEDVIVLSELFRHFSIPDALDHYREFRSERIHWITTSSDGPMKMLINIDSKMLSIRQQNIRENGPLNVQGWKKLLSINPITELDHYIDRNKLHEEKKTTGFLIKSKL